MTLIKVRQLDSVELLPGDKFRVVISTYFQDSVSKSETPGRDPEYIGLDPTKPAHQPLISAARSAWNAAVTAFGVDR